ncbi:hypothetical protein PtA15_4A822 [Puccinia triticina]|uniref:Uncharacterized protein n=1 Tax=Puccinia triticina TaxID=208348 RepID=A0ABY7CI67_9BASI|nr:uncharacterized protein PtA15_4A822 [Puccinia triticina]WAQ84369.1 hypothetical protein PtA15_4A822 [Puccinia triticina]
MFSAQMSCAAARLPVGCFSAICRVTQAVRRKASKSRSHSINDSRQQSAHRTRRCEHPGPTHQGSEFQQEIKKYLEYAQEQIVPSEELLREIRESDGRIKKKVSLERLLHIRVTGSDQPS